MDSSESPEDSALDSLSTSIEKLQRKAKAIGELDSKMNPHLREFSRVVAAMAVFPCNPVRVLADVLSWAFPPSMVTLCPGRPSGIVSVQL